MQCLLLYCACFTRRINTYYRCACFMRCINTLQLCMLHKMHYHNYLLLQSCFQAGFKSAEWRVDCMRYNQNLDTIYISYVLQKSYFAYVFVIFTNVLSIMTIKWQTFSWVFYAMCFEVSYNILNLEESWFHAFQVF